MRPLAHHREPYVVRWKEKVRTGLVNALDDGVRYDAVYGLESILGRLSGRLLVKRARREKARLAWCQQTCVASEEGAIHACSCEVFLVMVSV